MIWRSTGKILAPSDENIRFVITTKISGFHNPWEYGICSQNLSVRENEMLPQFRGQSFLKGNGMRFRSFVEFLVLQLVLSFVQVVPIETCARFCRWLAWLVTDVVKFRRKIIEENILGVYPEMGETERQDLSREMWYHLFLMGCEIAQAPRKIHDSNWRKYVFIRDKVQMTNYLIDYRPLVAVSGHIGNFEIGGYVTGLLGMPSFTVARKMDNPYLDAFINRFRGHNGQFMLPKDGSATAIQEVLDSGGILTLLGDQHAGTKGCWIDFLGRPAACHKAVALFTLSGNAPMMVSYCKHADQPLHFEIGCTGVADPLEMDDQLRDVKKLTQWYNDRLADAIYECPEQFWWVHRRWKEKPVRKTKKRKQEIEAGVQKVAKTCPPQNSITAEKT